MIFNLQASGRDARRNLLAGPSLAALALAALMLIAAFLFAVP